MNIEGLRFVSNPKYPHLIDFLEITFFAWICMCRWRGINPKRRSRNVFGPFLIALLIDRQTGLWSLCNFLSFVLSSVCPVYCPIGIIDITIAVYIRCSIFGVHSLLWTCKSSLFPSCTVEILHSNEDVVLKDENGDEAEFHSSDRSILQILMRHMQGDNVMERDWSFFVDYWWYIWSICEEYTFVVVISAEFRGL